MPTGISIHVGLNRVDPDHYGGWDGKLKACEDDASDMAALAEARGFKARELLTREATVAAVTSALEEAAKELRKGDILLLTYSGHGGQVPDLNGDEPSDRLDETWALYDRELVDDELYKLWSGFARGVRIAALSDSCHSGSVTRDLVRTVNPEALAETLDVDGDPEGRMKAVPDYVQRETYESHKRLYDEIQDAVPPIRDAQVGASVLLISGCQDNQTSADGNRNGLFTQRLLEVWNGGRFRGDYPSFHKEILKHMPLWQSPALSIVGTHDRAFEHEHPFTIRK